MPSPAVQVDAGWDDEVVRAGWPRLRTVGVAIAVLLVLLAGVSPALLQGESLSAFNLLLLAGSVLGIGLLLRWAVGGAAGSLASILIIIGVVSVVFAIGLTAFVVLSCCA
jgi:hypothetical protein